MSEETCWTLIRGAAAGGAVERDGFVRAYGPVIRAYLAARWRGTSWSGELDDALQEVFVDCLRDGGALGRVDSERPGGLRAFLFGLARRTAQKFEARGQRERARSGHESPPPEALVSDDASLSLVFDRAWVRALLQRIRPSVAHRPAWT